MRFTTLFSSAIMSFLLIVVSATASENTPPEIEGFSRESVTLAAKNMVGTVLGAPSGDVAVICSKEKEELAAWITHELESINVPYTLFKLSDKSPENVDRIKEHIKANNGSQGLMFLLHPTDMMFFIETVGSPDQGVKISQEYFFCDWFLSSPSLVRLHDADTQELEKFRSYLKSKVTAAKSIHISTDKGTDITVSPRSWIVSDGEIYTAPVESVTNGTIFVDASAYNGIPKIPFLLKVVDGRVVNLDELDTDDRQQSMVKKDMLRDANANVLAELGIGTSINSLWYAEMMEAERARGTCHFGFGMNINFEGGQNESSYHFDLVIQNPTITVDGVVICEKGEYLD